jgi:hypothetical protein
MQSSKAPAHWQSLAKFNMRMSWSEFCSAHVQRATDTTQYLRRCGPVSRHDRQDRYEKLQQDTDQAGGTVVEGWFQCEGRHRKMTRLSSKASKTLATDRRSVSGRLSTDI